VGRRVRIGRPDEDRSDLIAFLRTIPAVKFQPEKCQVDPSWRKQ